MSGFHPDSTLVDTAVPSPNHDARAEPSYPDMIILHYTGMTDADAALERLCDRQAKVSAHYLVFESGRIIQSVAESRRAWHAGVSTWEGETDINSRSIGIEIANPGHDYGYPDFPDVQITSVIALCRDILSRHAIRPRHVVAHSDVAPSRKNDPGEKFPWAALFTTGIGLWVAPAAIREGQSLRMGDHGEAVSELQKALCAYGYGLTASGDYDAATRDCIIAFQRHFRPVLIDGIADISTRETLQRLLAELDNA